MNWKGCGIRRSWPNLRYYRSIFLEGLRKTSKTSVRLAGLRLEIRIQDLPNTKEVYWPVGNDFRMFCTQINRHTHIKNSVWLRTGRLKFDPRQGQRIFLLAPTSRSALGPTQPPMQWVPGALSPGVKRGRDVTLTTHPHLVPRLSKSRIYTSSPPMCLHGV
jgi:hypothetical protein